MQNSARYMKKVWEGKCQRFVHYRIFENKGKGEELKGTKRKEIDHIRDVQKSLRPR
jgi:hypothetical protein